MGKIITVKQAENELGKVTEKIDIKSEKVLSWLDSENEKLMFLLKDKSLFVQGKSRNIIYSTSEYVESEDVFHVFTKTKINELLNLGGDDLTIFENRSSVFSILNGKFTLDYLLPCPPFCV